MSYDKVLSKLRQCDMAILRIYDLRTTIMFRYVVCQDLPESDLTSRLGNVPVNLNCEAIDMLTLITTVPHSSTTNAGKVRLGAMSPSLNTTDASKVRLGAMSPSLSTADSGKVRLGAMAPSLPKGR
jgi:hypothetical protein